MRIDESTHRSTRGPVRWTAHVLFLALALAVAAGAWAADRPRPTIVSNGALSGITYSTLASDTGTLLRGPRWSTDLNNNVNCPLPTQSQVANLRNYGFNALHLYGEKFSDNNPAGHCEDEIDKLVEWTSQNGLYLILTIGNGTANGTYDYAFADAFWRHYAPRYANRTHVVYEIQNEPYFNESTASSQPSPTHVINFERDMYNLIRQYAPNTPILLFSYAVFGNASGVLQDVQALGGAIDWSNAAIAFHGYAGLSATESTLDTVLANGYPCMQTEFLDHTAYKQNVDQTVLYESRFTSWMTFLNLPDVFNNAVYKTPLDQAWVVWAADYGTWPATSAPPVGKVVSLKAVANNKYVSAVNSGAAPLRAQSSTIGTAEKFTVVANQGRWIGLRAVVNNKYVTAENLGDDFLIADRNVLALWEQFEWMKLPNGKVVLRARVDNEIVSADLNLMNPPQLIANRSQGGPWERFTVTVH